MTALREEVRTYRCRCVADDYRCREKVSGPDEPFCARCENRHPGSRHVITAVPPGVYP